MDEIKRALLGDKAAQQAVTDRGELLPCPFCGGEAMKEYDTMIPFEYVVCCGDCGVMTTTSEDEKVAIREWNTRLPLLNAKEMARLRKDTNVPTNPTHISREAWGPCKVCKIQGLSEAWMLQRKKFCTYCGRPLTDEAWAELEKRLRG